MNRKILMFLAMCLTALIFTGCGQANRADPLQQARDAAAAGNSPDFAALREQKPGAVAWLSIPGAGISEPVTLWREGPAPEDSLYVQAEYNGPDFNAPVTVVYGSLSNDGSLYGTLQRSFTEDGSLQKCGRITVYTPEKVLQYRAFGATLYNNNHLLRTYEAEQIPQLLDSVRHYHVMSRQWDDAVPYSEGDSLLILSAHAAHSDDMRYLVLAKLADEAG